MHVHKFVNKSGARILAENAELNALVEHVMLVFRNSSSDSIRRGNRSSEKLRSILLSAEPSLKSKILVERGFPSSLPSSHVEVEFQFEKILDTGTRLFCQFEVLGDNREAIGTTLLKLEMANRGNKTLGESLSVGIALEKNLRNAGWDGAVGTFDEYEHAIISTYADFLTTGHVLLGLGL